MVTQRWQGPIPRTVTTNLISTAYTMAKFDCIINASGNLAYQAPDAPTQGREPVVLGHEAHETFGAVS